MILLISYYTIVVVVFPSSLVHSNHQSGRALLLLLSLSLSSCQQRQKYKLWLNTTNWGIRICNLLLNVSRPDIGLTRTEESPITERNIGTSSGRVEREFTGCWLLTVYLLSHPVTQFIYSISSILHRDIEAGIYRTSYTGSRRREVSRREVFIHIPISQYLRSRINFKWVLPDLYSAVNTEVKSKIPDINIYKF